MGYVTIFCQIILSDNAKKIVEEPFSAVFRKSSASENFMDKRGEGGGEYGDFPSKNFCLTEPKTFVREPFSVSLVLGIENFYASVGYVTIFCQIILSDSAEKFCRGDLQCCNSEKFR